MIMLALGAVGAALAAFALVHGFNMLRYRDSEKAVKETLSGLPAVTLGATSAGLVIVTDVAFLLLGALAAFPDVIVTSLLGVVGYVSITGLVELQPETWGLVVILAGALVGLLGGER